MASSLGSTPTEAPTADTDRNVVFFFWVRRCTGEEVDEKLFSFCSGGERNISKHGFNFYAEVFLFNFVIGE